MYDIKALYEAKSVTNAIELLLAHPEAKIIAGGSDVLVQIREGKLAGCELVSIFALDELRGISLEENGDLRICSLTSFSSIANNELIKKHIAVLGEAVDMVGGPQIRNIGTIGGNTCNGVTSADSASTLLAYDAVVELTGENGKRLVPIEQFYIKAGTVDLRAGELQTAIIIPKAAYEGYFGYYLKYGMRRAMDIATTGCSVNVKLSSDKTKLEDLRIAFGVAGPIPLRAKAAQAAGRGETVSSETLALVADTVLQDVKPRDSWRASKEFRLHLARTLTERALREAINRAGGELNERNYV